MEGLVADCKGEVLWYKHLDSLDSAEEFKDGFAPIHAQCSCLPHLPLFASSMYLM